MSFEIVALSQQIPDLPDSAEALRSAWAGGVFLVSLLVAVGVLTAAILRFRKTLSAMIETKFSIVSLELSEIKTDTKALLLESRSHHDDIDRLKSRVDLLEHEIRNTATRLSRLEGRFENSNAGGAR